MIQSPYNKFLDFMTLFLSIFKRNIVFIGFVAILIPCSEVTITAEEWHNRNQVSNGVINFSAFSNYARMRDSVQFDNHFTEEIFQPCGTTQTLHTCDRLHCAFDGDETTNKTAYESRSQSKYNISIWHILMFLCVCVIGAKIGIFIATNFFI